MGNHFADFGDFEGSQTSSLASPSKSPKNHESNTANLRMLGGFEKKFKEKTTNHAEGFFEGF
ncbi:hypothetical protein [Helicobacter sp. MIT 05-5294]|uniref:hypothetical protein n=1 Tax=Helicobacter sp. MIT 05-5294 TaxID=1548150 RepID=UPI0010FCEFA1|nr:hypothetical protein [Helicobacter sp. MIT 05-5294]TLD85437.1 hypothetical protein LS69_009540 [Helicobacter sp. MIT 05-5294]